MPSCHALLLTACLLASLPARAEEAPPTKISDALYKGVVGKVLDVVPMDAQARTTLQKTGAVVSGTLTGRSLSVWAGLGLGNPVLLIAGVAWGIYAANHIRPARDAAQDSGDLQVRTVALTH